MRSWSSSSGWRDQRNLPRSNAAFSLIELMVAVTILSLLILLAVPTYQRLQRKAKAAAIVNDFRVFATAFQAHAHEAGSWPPETPPGIMPAGMTAEEIKFDDWARTTPIGGKYDWEYEQTHRGTKYRAAIAITPTDDAPLLVDADLFRAIDIAIDNGDPLTGIFLIGDGNRPVFIIEN